MSMTLSVPSWLTTPDPARPLTRTAESYMTLKGIQDTAQLLGAIEVSATLAYFYYLVSPSSLIELEVEHLLDERRYSRKVTGHVTDAEEIAHLLVS